MTELWSASLKNKWLETDQTRAREPLFYFCGLCLQTAWWWKLRGLLTELPCREGGWNTAGLISFSARFLFPSVIICHLDPGCTWICLHSNSISKLSLLENWFFHSEICPLCISSWNISIKTDSSHYSPKLSYAMLITYKYLLPWFIFGISRSTWEKTSCLPCTSYSNSSIIQMLGLVLILNALPNPKSELYKCVTQ